MPANLLNHQALLSVQTTVTSTPLTIAVPEKAGQTFVVGVPVQLNAGFCQKWDGATVAAGVLGISMIPASNLASNGAGAPSGFGQITGIGATQSYGSVQNQSAAVNIASSAPFTDGRTLVEAGQRNTIFEGQFDNSAGAVATDWTPTLSMVGSQFGITFDAVGSAYIDGAKVTAGTNTVVQLVSIHPNDAVVGGAAGAYIANARVRFQILASALQVY